MDVDQMTVADLRRLLEVASLLQRPAEPIGRGAGVLGGFVGRWVVVRSSASGVWWGRLLSAEGDTVLLAEARRCWHWTGADSCSGLALRGPTGDRIASPVPEQAVLGCCEVAAGTPEAKARWDAVPEWVIT